VSLTDQISNDLASAIEPSVVADILVAYKELRTEHRAGDLEAALTKAGRFVENTFRALVHIQTDTAPPEIKSVSGTMTKLENDTNLPDSIRLLIPRALYGMMYNLRSKRNAVHVKEIDPRRIDVSMAVSCASWVLAELVRQYHVSDEKAVEAAMIALSRTSLPFVESIAGEKLVSRKVDARTEMLLLLGDAAGTGLTRTELGKLAKCSAPGVTTSLKSLREDRFIHLVTDTGRFHITGTGEQELARMITELPESSPARKSNGKGARSRSRRKP
jgi:hypothetical protein